jgi:hypothetical protein
MLGECCCALVGKGSHWKTWNSMTCSPLGGRTKTLGKWVLPFFCPSQTASCLHLATPSETVRVSSPSIMAPLQRNSTGRRAIACNCTYRITYIHYIYIYNMYTYIHIYIYIHDMCILYIYIFIIYIYTIHILYMYILYIYTIYIYIFPAKQ